MVMPQDALRARRCLSRQTITEAMGTVNREMPPRPTADPLARAVGARIRQLREEAGLTMEKLAYESKLGSKGHLSNLERGLARPTIQTLDSLAERLEVKLLDLVTFPDEDDRAKLIDQTRGMSTSEIRRLLKESRTSSKRPSRASKS